MPPGFASNNFDHENIIQNAVLAAVPGNNPRGRSQQGWRRVRRGNLCFFAIAVAIRRTVGTKWR